MISGFSVISFLLYYLIIARISVNGLSEAEAEAKGSNLRVNFVAPSGYPSLKRLGQKKAACNFGCTPHTNQI